MLRSDFNVPSRRTLQRRCTALYNNVRTAVEDQLATLKHIVLCLDGWEDHQRCEVLAIYGTLLGRHQARPYSSALPGRPPR